MPVIKGNYGHGLCDRLRCAFIKVVLELSLGEKKPAEAGLGIQKNLILIISFQVILLILRIQVEIPQ